MLILTRGPWCWLEAFQVWLKALRLLRLGWMPLQLVRARCLTSNTSRFLLPLLSDFSCFLCIIGLKPVYPCKVQALNSILICNSCSWTNFFTFTDIISKIWKKKLQTCPPSIFSFFCLKVTGLYPSLWEDSYGPPLLIKWVKKRKNRKRYWF